MTIQFFLTAMLLAIALVVAVQRTTSQLLRVAILIGLAVAGFFVWSPDRTTAIAAVLGVGRGADLLLYLWVVITFALLLVMYLMIIRMGRTITRLTRAIALDHAQTPTGKGTE